jgi:ubiquinone/menaquinone biosynthesis C-methylase UbiE
VSDRTTVTDAAFDPAARHTGGPTGAARARVAAQHAVGDWLDLLRCPLTGQRLCVDGAALVSEDGTHRYTLSPSGVPLFGEAWLSADGAVQRTHYDAISTDYIDNLAYPHTREYMAYLDRALLGLFGDRPLGTVAEICCGTGEGLQLLGRRAGRAVGVDVSVLMLSTAAQRAQDASRLFIQSDATRLALADSQFDTVVVLGGIHHVNDRARLYAEVHRILKPNGWFVWREPLDDFALWRGLRRIIYRASPTLQEDTEHPLRTAETQLQLERAGFRVDVWRPMGFLGYCFLMNSDVMRINRMWRFIPGAAALTRAAARIDEWCLKIPGLTGGGILVIGRASRRSSDV